MVLAVMFVIFVTPQWRRTQTSNSLGTWATSSANLPHPTTSIQQREERSSTVSEGWSSPPASVAPTVRPPSPYGEDILPSCGDVPRLQLRCSGQTTKNPKGVHVSPWAGVVDTFEVGHCYLPPPTQTSKAMPIGFIAPRLCMDYTWLDGKSLCALRADPKSSLRRSATFVAAAGVGNDKGGQAASNKSVTIEAHSFSVRVRSEYQKSKNFRVVASTRIPLDKPQVPTSCAQVAHVVYFEDEHYALNFAHVVYRVIGIVRTGLLLRSLLESAQEGFASSRGPNLRVEPFELTFVNVMEVAGRSSGTFMQPLINTLTPSLFRDSIVVPEDGVKTFSNGVTTHLQCPEDEMRYQGGSHSFRVTDGLGGVETHTHVRCFDNAIVEHVRPQFHTAFDTQFSTAAVFLRDSIKSSWLGNVKGNNFPARITVVNRVNSRIISNIDDVVANLSDALRRQCKLGPQTKCVVPEVQLVTLENAPLSVQASTFHHSSVVVAVHGAALAWAIAMRPETTVVEIVPPAFDRSVGPVSETFSGLLNALNINHVVLKMRDQNGYKPRKSKEFVLAGADIVELNQMVVAASR